MRKIIVKWSNNKKNVFITDWNQKTWTLVELDKSSCERQCKEMKGTFHFKSIGDFIIQLYGNEKIYPEWNSEEVFVNYETEIVYE